ncbi:MAG: hypothetical protein ACLPYS_02240 [Vulcanimicrobiaceae bacterium]
MLIDVRPGGAAADLDRAADADIERAKRYGRAAEADPTIAECPRQIHARWRRSPAPPSGRPAG